LYQEVSKAPSNDCETCGSTFDSRYVLEVQLSFSSPSLSFALSHHMLLSYNEIGNAVMVCLKYFLLQEQVVFSLGRNRSCNAEDTTEKSLKRTRK
jgi:hypothetical protein